MLIRWSSILVLLSLSCVLMAGCKSKQKDTEEVYEPAEITYTQGVEALKKKQYKKAAELFAKVERDHPFDDLATQGLIMEAYTLFEEGEYEEAITACERFLQLHPRHEDASYMTYLKAVALYYQIVPVEKDQSITEEARVALQDVMTQYPNTDYARDAKLKYDLTVDHLAGKEMDVARYYLVVRHNVTAAANRFRGVITDYQKTSHIPEALYRMVECYVALGIKDEAERYAAVLGYNYPASNWYKKAYALLAPSAISR